MHIIPEKKKNKGKKEETCVQLFGRTCNIRNCFDKLMIATYH